MFILQRIPLGNYFSKEILCKFFLNFQTWIGFFSTFFLQNQKTRKLRKFIYQIVPLKCLKYKFHNLAANRSLKIIVVKSNLARQSCFYCLYRKQTYLADGCCRLLAHISLCNITIKNRKYLNFSKFTELLSLLFHLKQTIKGYSRET